MNFVKMEGTAKKVLARFPKTRRFFKQIYHRVSYTLSHEDIKCEGNINRIPPYDNYEYFYGYYDKSPWDITDRYIIALRVNKSNKVPDSTEKANVVVFDTKNNNEIYVIGETNCWNTQQGCMAQWLGPDYCSKIIYNDCRNNKYVSVIYNFVEKREEKVFDMPIYDVSKDGKFALTLDFSRLHNLRKGYGYANINEETKKEKCPDKTCIWKIDLNSGDISSVIKYTDLAHFESREEMKDAKHKVNHLMISPNGKRFMVLHRWFKHNEKFTRLVTMNIDGTEMYNLSDDNFVSHCCWKNDDEILSFLRKKESGNHYYLMKDRTKEYKMFWEELNTDGHCTYSFDGKYVITDTYPNRKRMASVYLCEESKYPKRVVKVFAPFKFDNDVRCDLHPRWNHEGNKICIDSVHEGKKQLYVIDISDFKIKEDKENQKSVTILMATYNGEKYIKKQIESLLNQKNVKINLLIRDDGSKDNTINILNDYQKNNDNIKWYTGEHLNVQKGFLDLMKNAPVSDYYAFCDQDDIWDEDKLYIAVKSLENLDKEKPLIYYCGQRLVDENERFLSNHFISDKRSDYTNYMISNVAGCTTVFNKKLLDIINSKTPEFILMHDSWIYKVCLAVGGKAYADPFPHISYRQHGNNVTGINNSIKGKVKQAKRYINDFYIQKQMQNLYECYSDVMIDEYKKATKDVCEYNKSFKNWIKFSISNKADFKNKSLNIIYKIKIFLRKM